MNKHVSVDMVITCKVSNCPNGLFNDGKNGTVEAVDKDMNASSFDDSLSLLGVS
jgi:hypothetical protein